MMVESIVAMRARSAAPVVKMSAWQTVRVRLGRSTRPQARNPAPPGRCQQVDLELHGQDIRVGWGQGVGGVSRAGYAEI
jgi:hypothetical protein